METLEHPSGRVTDLTNTNRLVRFYEGALGLKTGYSSEARHCIAATAVRGDMTLMVILLHFDSSKARFDSAQRLLDYGFSAFEKVSVAKTGEVVKENVPVGGSDVKYANLVASKEIYALVKKGNSNAYEIIESFPARLQAPLTNKEPVGGITVKLSDGTSIYTPVVIQQDEIRSGIWSIVGKILSLW